MKHEMLARVLSGYESEKVDLHAAAEYLLRAVEDFKFDGHAMMDPRDVLVDGSNWMDPKQILRRSFGWGKDLDQTELAKQLNYYTKRDIYERLLAEKEMNPVILVDDWEFGPTLADGWGRAILQYALGKPIKVAKYHTDKPKTEASIDLIFYPTLSKVLSDLSQAAPAPDRLKKKKLYHGTDTKQAAEEIWKTGIKPDLSDTPVNNVARPVAGRIYLALDLKEAIPYMLGGAYAGSDPLDGMIEKAGQFGYMFVVEGSALTDVQPDEDQVGQAVHDRAFPWIEDYLHELRDEVPEYDTEIEDEDGNVTKNEDPYIYHQSLLQQVDQGEYAGWIRAGHVLLPSLTDEQKYDVIRKYGNVAHLGSVQPTEMWEFDKNKSIELKSNGSNLFKLAKKVNGRATSIVDPRFEEEPTRQAFKDALPFEGPWNGYGQKSPIEKVYPAISRVLAAKSYEKMNPATFKYSNAQGFITEDGSFYQIHETHSDAMQENPGFDRPTVVSVGHDGGNNVTFPFSVWEDPKAKQHRTLRILLGALDAHGFGWDDMEVGLGDYWYHATKVIKVNPKTYMKVGPKAKIASLLLSIIDPRHKSKDFRKNFVAPVDQTYGWGMGNGVAEEPNPMHTEAEEDETKTK